MLSPYQWLLYPSAPAAIRARDLRLRGPFFRRQSPHAKSKPRRLAPASNGGVGTIRGAPFVLASASWRTVGPGDYNKEPQTRFAVIVQQGGARWLTSHAACSVLGSTRERKPGDF